YISLDPAMRGWMNEGRSYIPPVQLGEVMRALTVGVVVSSRHPDFRTGDYVSGAGGVQCYFTAPGPQLTRVDRSQAPLPTYLSVLGMPGFTAYFGLLEVGQPRPGETVLVSAAAGAVGSVVGQIARLKGCRAVGIAGGPEKCQYLTEVLGFDAAIDYKQGNLRQGIKQACPEGVDVYFDNVGGDMLDTVLTRLRRRARVVICGAISQYNQAGYAGPRNYMSLLVNRARMEGFVVFDYRERYPEALREMSTWLASGKLRTREHIFEGLDRFPEVLLRLFTGEKLGKLVLKVNALDD
ncbi:MAG: NADP-dependent oxidoreductase, partial [Bacteroidetes bacterium]